MTSERVEALLAQLDLHEQVLLLGGRDYWHTEPVERLGIPSIHLSDGPVGVRGARAVGSTSVSFPCGTAIGATFDPTAAAELADALADECLDRGVHVLLGPTVNLQRHPLGGRHFECYSEDPILTADLAVAYVRALQARGVAATVKHFVANDTEYRRHTISSDVDESVLEALYYVPFEEAVRDAGAYAVMASYNRVNGTHAAENLHLIEEVLRRRWGYDGLVMSDWFGTQSTVASVAAGLDLEMPGPPLHYGPLLEEAVEAGEVGASLVAERARHVLQLLERVGALDRTGASNGSAPRAGADARTGGAGRADPPAPDDRDDRAARRSVGERRELARKLAAQSFVLMRNESALLPLDLRPGALLAVVGPNAARTTGQGGGSATVAPERTPSILAALREHYEPLGIEVLYEPGCPDWEETPALDAPMRIEYFAVPAGGTSAFGTEPLHTESTPRPPLLWQGSPVPGVGGLEAGRFAVRCTAELEVDRSGGYEIVLAQVGSARAYVDGALVVKSRGGKGRRFSGLGSKDAVGTCALERSRTYRLVVEYEVTSGSPVAGLLVGLRQVLPPAEALIGGAAALAGRADAVVCVLGTNAKWETEGRDRSTMRLPGAQDDLAAAVAAANARTAVVLNTGSPVAMDWAEEAGAVLQVWFGGEAAGQAVADVLSGADEPGGRLPHTVAKRLEDTPAFPFYPGADDHAHYGEGLLVGYRHYATKEVSPRYYFGHGLGYTTFSIEGATVSRRAGDSEVTASVRNTGARRGAAVLQAYLSPKNREPAQPALQFCGSARHIVAAGEDAAARVAIRPRRLRCPPGAYRVLIGFSADPDRLQEAGEITVEPLRPGS